MNTTDLAVIGAGQAALQLALSLRSAGHLGSITLIGDEADVPYSRPPLSKAFLKGTTEREDLFFRPREWFADNAVTLLTGTQVQSVDCGRRELVTDRGLLGFGQLVFATGTRPRHLPDLPPTLDNVIYMRGLQDAEKTLQALPRIARTIVIGGGFIGLEFAAVMRALGREVTVLEAAPRLMGRAISAPLSAWFLDLHRQNGVDVRLSARVGSVRSASNRVAGLTLEGGEFLPADLVVVGVGVLPNDDLAKAAGLETRNGIAVDDRLRASVPGIHAIGDCAYFQAPDGGRLRLESVQNAVDQAKHLATILMGGDAPYAATPWFWSDQFDAKLQIAGLMRDGASATTMPGPSGGFSIEHRIGDALVCVESVNDARRHIVARKTLRTI